MITRRHTVSTIAAVSLMSASAPPASARLHRGTHRAGATFANFLRGVRAEARAAGISLTVLASALAIRRPNQAVLDRDRNQPEFNLGWDTYRLRLLTEKRISDGHRVYRKRSTLLETLWQRFGVEPGIVVAIWGLESDFGNRKGTFEVVEALATLAFASHRPEFFRRELLAALRILDQREIEPEQMLGSYAGAMGQPQFMPSSYLRYAVDFEGDGRRDIWCSEADSLASIANYLQCNGWNAGSPWGQSVTLLAPLGDELTGRDQYRSLEAWDRLGVRRVDGTRFSRLDVTGALLLPAGASRDAFMVYSNFNVIRRYNASDFYAIAVGLLGSAVA